MNFMEDCSSQGNKPSTQEGDQSVTDRGIISLLGRLKVQALKRSDVALMMKKMSHKPVNANGAFIVMRNMFNLDAVWDVALTAPRHAALSPCTDRPLISSAT